MNGQTLIEKYYEINGALNDYLTALGINCPVVKYGVDPLTTKTVTKDQSANRYPYFQSHLLPGAKPQSWTTQKSGVYTIFEYQLSFFTSPRTEGDDDTALMNIFEVAKMAFTDIDSALLVLGETTIANVLDVKTQTDFGVVSGAVVPTGVIIVKMSTVTGYPRELPEVAETTNIDDAIILTAD